MVAQTRSLLRVSIACLANNKRIPKTPDVILFLLATVNMCLWPIEMMMTVTSNVIGTLILCVKFFIVPQNIKEIMDMREKLSNSSVYEIGCHIFGSF